MVTIFEIYTGNKLKIRACFGTNVHAT